VARDIIQGGKKVEIFPCGEARKKRPLGGDREADVFANAAGFDVHVRTFYQDPPCVGQEHGGKQLQGGRFSTAVGAQQDQHLPAGNAERYLV
jgi:hypothetical protein